MCLVLLGITSCKKNIDNCGCKFNLDIIIKNPDVYNEFLQHLFTHDWISDAAAQDPITDPASIELFYKLAPSMFLTLDRNEFIVRNIADILNGNFTEGNVSSTVFTNLDNVQVSFLKLNMSNQM